MSLRFTDADLAAFRARTAEWESRGVVRTHVMQDDGAGEAQLVARAAPARARLTASTRITLTEREVLRV